MKGSDIYFKLKKAYSTENLTLISTSLITAYRNKDVHFLREIVSRIETMNPRHKQKLHLLFARLITRYHPDRLNHYQQKIETFFQRGALHELSAMDHIFPVLAAVSGQLKPDWKMKHSRCAAPESDWGNQWSPEEDTFVEIRDFFSAWKHQEYGTLDVPLEYHHLDDIDGEMDLSSYEIEDLTGVEYCLNISSLDLSHNSISDVSLIGSLTDLEELYLAHNDITDVSPLKNNRHLRVLDISENQVDDISPLYGLDELEFVNLHGNTIPRTQIFTLKQRIGAVIY